MEKIKKVRIVNDDGTHVEIDLPPRGISFAVVGGKTVLTVSDRQFRSWWGKRNSVRSSGAPVVLYPCPHCKNDYPASKIRTHKPQCDSNPWVVGRRCSYCNEVQANKLARKEHEINCPFRRKRYEEARMALREYGMDLPAMGDRRT